MEKGECFLLGDPAATCAPSRGLSLVCGLSLRVPSLACQPGFLGRGWSTLMQWFTAFWFTSQRLTLGCVLPLQTLLWGRSPEVPTLGTPPSLSTGPCTASGLLPPVPDSSDTAVCLSPASQTPQRSFKSSPGTAGALETFQEIRWEKEFLLFQAGICLFQPDSLLSGQRKFPEARLCVTQ